MSDVIHHTGDRIEADVIAREARRLRAQAIATLMAVAGRGIANGVRRIGRGLVAMAEAVEAGRRAQALHSELTQMSDRQLADVGVSREGIPAAIIRALEGTGRAPAPIVGAIGPADAVPAPQSGEIRKAA